MGAISGMLYTAALGVELRVSDTREIRLKRTQLRQHRKLIGRDSTAVSNIYAKAAGCRVDFAAALNLF